MFMYIMHMIPQIRTLFFGISESNYWILMILQMCELIIKMHIALKLLPSLLKMKPCKPKYYKLFKNAIKYGLQVLV